MFSFLKRIFSRSDDTPEVTPEVEPGPGAVPVAEPPPLPAEKEMPLPAPAPRATGATVNATAAGPCVQIAMSAVLPGLPEDLRNRLAARGSASVALPIEQVVPQLAQGAVRLPLAELRRLAPDVFGDVRDSDTLAVSFPLAEVLSQLDPSRYARRPNQKKVTVPENVLGLFGPDGQRVIISSSPPRQESAKATPDFSGVAASAAPSRFPGGAAPAMPAAAPALPASAAKVVSPSAPGPSEPSSPVCGAPLGMAAIPQPSAPVGFKPAPETPAAPRPGNGAADPALQPPVAQPSVSPEPANHRAPLPASGETMRVPLSQLTHGWPDEVHRDIDRLQLHGTDLALPVEAVEQALKSGQVTFAWKKLCGWVEAPTAPEPSPAAAEMTVALPLKVIAPLFMARYRPVLVQKKAEVDESIPELFGKGGKPQWTPPTVLPAAAPIAKAPAMPAPSAPGLPLRMSVPPGSPGLSSRPHEVQPAPVAMPLPAAPAVDLETVVGPAGRRHSAKEIVANLARLPGVQGALLALSDGLMVASVLPSEMKSELVAAFLPQIFGRMGQYARELSMGSVRCIALTVESGAWQIVKQSNIYLAVLCAPDKALPAPLLATIAAELNNQQQ